jgi:hypothetical protein
LKKGPSHVRKRRTEFSKRFEDAFARFDGTVVTNEDDHYALSLGRGHKTQEGAQLIRARLSKLVVELDCLGSLVEPVNQHSAEHRSNRVKLEFEGGGNTEIPAAPAQSPEKILVLGLARRKQPAVCGHDIDRNQVVAGKAVVRDRVPLVPTMIAVVRARSVSNPVAWPFLLARRSIKMPPFRFPIEKEMRDG